MKTDSTAAPEEYNIAHRKAVDSWGYFDKAIPDPFDVAQSQTWITTWPKFAQEWASMCVKAVVGQVTMAQYRQYIDGLNANADIQKAGAEFAASYKEIFGK
jgi:putative aldouronate transport system substrate-binding protein